ncbi:MAG: hypothetical protein LBM08_09895 [Dysgonamonadaceae bacterium]|nr:hypothetical protein [Dysgonamonadaceae bacterium]
MIPTRRFTSGYRDRIRSGLAYAERSTGLLRAIALAMTLCGLRTMHKAMSREV